MFTTLYGALTGAAEDNRSVDRSEARNGCVQAGSLTLTKLADGLIDPKLVLSWLLNALGAPAAAIGALVPIREAGALLPQLALAKKIEENPRRKQFWIAGSAIQGIAAIGIALSALILPGVTAGYAILLCLAVLSLARALCSISHKDTLARTLPKRRRGAVTGAAGSAAAAGVLGFGGALSVGLIPLTPFAISIAVMAAGGLWLFSALLFQFLREPERPPKDNGDEGLEEFVAPIWEDRELRRFILARGLLTVTALAPPFIVILAAGDSGGSALGTLGPFVLASGIASIASSYVWGRLSDRSSRQTMIAAAALGAVIFAVAGYAGMQTGGLFGLLGGVTIIFLTQIAYEGVRAARKLHLTDMAKDEDRARYTALSNTVIGIVLLAGGALGVLADRLGPATVLIVFAALSGFAALVAFRLEEVQQTPGD